MAVPVCQGEVPRGRARRRGRQLVLHRLRLVLCEAGRTVQPPRKLRSREQRMAGSSPPSGCGGPGDVRIQPRGEQYCQGRGHVRDPGGHRACELQRAEPDKQLQGLLAEIIYIHAPRCPRRRDDGTFRTLPGDIHGEEYPDFCVIQFRQV